MLSVATRVFSWSNVYLETLPLSLSLLYIKNTSLNTKINGHCEVLPVVKVKSLSCVLLCDPMDCSLPGSSIHGIFQARVLEWIAVSFSRGCSRPRDRTWVSHIADRCFTVWTTSQVYSSSRINIKKGPTKGESIWKWAQRYCCADHRQLQTWPPIHSSITEGTRWF